MRGFFGQRGVVAFAAWLGFASALNAQIVVPWDVFQDGASASNCDVINAASDQLVLLSGTRELVIVTGPDVIQGHTEVDDLGCVFFDGQQAGFIEFATDGDGLRSLWWLSPTGRVLDVTGLSSEPVETELFPDDFVDVPCDACDYWDDPTVCAEPAPEPEPLPIAFNICAGNTSMSLAFTALSLMALKFVRRRNESFYLAPADGRRAG